MERERGYNYKRYIPKDRAIEHHSEDPLMYGCNRGYWLILNVNWLFALSFLSFLGSCRGCEVDSSWRDKNGESCTNYQLKSYCLNGVESSGWESGINKFNYAPLENFANNEGVNAYQACCNCQWHGVPIKKSERMYISPLGDDTYQTSLCNEMYPCLTFNSMLSEAVSLNVTDLEIVFMEGNYNVSACNGVIMNNYVMNSLILRGEGNVYIDCTGTDNNNYWFQMGLIGRIANVTIHNLEIENTMKWKFDILIQFSENLFLSNFTYGNYQVFKIFNIAHVEMRDSNFLASQYLNIDMKFVKTSAFYNVNLTGGYGGFQWYYVDSVIYDEGLIYNAAWSEIDITFAKNVFLNKIDTSFSYGLQISGVDNLVISNSKVSFEAFTAVDLKGCGIVTISNCTFNENQSYNGLTLYYGAAITLTDYYYASNAQMWKYIAYYENTVIHIANSSFVNNNLLSLQNPTSAYGAVAIYLTSADSVIDVNFVNNMFSNNAGVGGGAIYLFNFQNSKIKIQGCIFESNYVFTNDFLKSGGGGAIFMQHLIKSTITISNSTFSNNVVPVGNGGAISLEYGDRSILLIENCLFFGNTAGSSGAAIYSQRASSVLITNSNFERNFANKFGGALYVEFSSSPSSLNVILSRDNDIYNSEGLIISRSLFSFNSASSGGAVCSSFSYVKCKQSSFIGNSALEYGNAVYIFGSQASLFESNNIFLDNFNNILSGYGGAVSGDYILSLTSKFSQYNGNSNGYGGAISLFNIENIVISDLRCKANNANLLGGCLFFKSTLNYPLAHSIDKSNFISNLVMSGKGGSLHVDGYLTIYMSNSVFKSSIGYRAGAISIGKNSVLTLHDNIEMSNNIGFYGGAISLLDCSSLLLVPGNNVSFVSNQAEWGGVFEGSGFVNLIGQVEISNNIASTPSVFQSSNVDSLNSEIGSGGIFWYSSSSPPQNYLSEISNKCQVLSMSNPLSIVKHNLASDGGNGLSFASLPLEGCIQPENAFYTVNNITVSTFPSQLSAANINIYPGLESKLDLSLLDYFGNGATSSRYENFQLQVRCENNEDGSKFIILKELIEPFIGGVSNSLIVAGVSSISMASGNLLLSIVNQQGLVLVAPVNILPCQLVNSSLSLQKVVQSSPLWRSDSDIFVCRVSAQITSFSSSFTYLLEFILYFIVFLNVLQVLYLFFTLKKAISKSRSTRLWIINSMLSICTCSGMLLYLQPSLPSASNCNTIEALVMLCPLSVFLNFIVSMWRYETIFTATFEAVVVNNMVIILRSFSSLLICCLVLFLPYYFSNSVPYNPVINDVFHFKSAVCTPSNNVAHNLFVVFTLVLGIFILTVCNRYRNKMLELRIQGNFINLHYLNLYIMFGVFALAVVSLAYILLSLFDNLNWFIMNTLVITFIFAFCIFHTVIMTLEIKNIHEVKDDKFSSLAFSGKNKLVSHFSKNNNNNRVNSAIKKEGEVKDRKKNEKTDSEENSNTTDETKNTKKMMELVFEMKKKFKMENLKINAKRKQLMKKIVELCKVENFVEEEASRGALLYTLVKLSLGEKFSTLDKNKEIVREDFGGIEKRRKRLLLIHILKMNKENPFQLEV